MFQDLDVRDVANKFSIIWSDFKNFLIFYFLNFLLFMTYQTTGIILKIIDRGEADQIFNIYTKDKGKIVALGRGTKKIQSKLNGQLQPFSLVYLMVASGKKYDHIAGAENIKNFLKIKKSIRKIILGSYAMELVDKMTRENESEPEIFDLLVRFFEAIELAEMDGKIIEAYRQNFLIKLFSILGLTPPPEIICSKNKLAKFSQEHLECELKSLNLLNLISP